MNRHIIIRAIVAVIWVVVGVVALVRGQTAEGVISLAAGAAFGFSSFSMMKKM